MNTDMFRKYYEYKAKTLYQYSMLLNKILGIDKNHLWHNKKDRDKIFQSIILIYLNNYAENSEVNHNLVKGFISNSIINKYNLDIELMAIIQYFIENNMILKLPEYEQEIILLAIILNIANELDISTSPFVKNKNNYNTIVINSVQEYNKIDFIHLIDDGKKTSKILIELVKTNVRKERRIFDLLTSYNSFNKYIDISKEDKYFLSQYNYSIPNIDKYDNYAVKKIYEDNKYVDDFILISADLVVATMMKILSIRKPFKLFFIPIKKQFILNDKNIKEFNKIANDPILKKYIFILINHNDLNSDVIKKLKKYNCGYYIYCDLNSKLDGHSTDCRNYLVSKDFYKKNKDMISEWKKEDINIIKENFEGFVTDKYLVSN